MDRFDPELMKGTNETLVLALIGESERHGYAIIQELRERSIGRFTMNEGALYPLLHRLERAGQVRSRTLKQGARARRCYRLTAAGRRTLAARRSEWQDYSQFVAGVLNPAPEETA